MNDKMFLRILRQSNIRVDNSDSQNVLPDSLKFVQKDGLYNIFQVDKECNKLLIISTTSKNKAYREAIKYLNIKLNKFGEVIPQSTKSK